LGFPRIGSRRNEPAQFCFECSGGAPSLFLSAEKKGKIIQIKNLFFGGSYMMFLALVAGESGGKTPRVKVIKKITELVVFPFGKFRNQAPMGFEVVLLSLAF
jgi:hypothetical protein